MQKLKPCLLIWLWCYGATTKKWKEINCSLKSCVRSIKENSGIINKHCSGLMLMINFIFNINHYSMSLPSTNSPSQFPETKQKEQEKSKRRWRGWWLQDPRKEDGEDDSRKIPGKKMERTLLTRSSSSLDFSFLYCFKFARVFPN